MRSLGGDPPQWVLLRPLLFGLKGERLLQGAPDWSFSNSLQILGTRYVVRSAIHHAGSSPTTGHYTASVYMDDGTILSLDGGRVREIAQPEVSTSSASLLLCQRVHGAKYVHEWLVPRLRCVWRVDVGCVERSTKGTMVASGSACTPAFVPHMHACMQPCNNQCWVAQRAGV